MKFKNDRKRDVRVRVTHRVFGEYDSRFHINRGTVIDGWIDGKGNFRRANLTIFPTHFRVIGRFYIHKTKHV